MFTYRYNALSDNFDIVQDSTLLTLKGTVATTGDLPLTGNSENDLYVVKADDKLYTWNKATPDGILSDWVDAGSAASIDWSVVTNKPTSTVENIDDAVTKKHDKQHDLNASADHNGVAGAVENNFVTFDSNGLPKDSSHKSVELNASKNTIITLCGNDQNYLFTVNAFYTAFTHLCFCGTDNIGIPTNIKIIGHVEKAADAGDVRIYDVTNSKVICEKTGIVNLVPEVIDMGVLSNLPTGEAVLEIQVRNLSGNRETRISSLVVKF